MSAPFPLCTWLADQPPGSRFKPMTMEGVMPPDASIGLTQMQRDRRLDGLEGITTTGQLCYVCGRKPPPVCPLCPTCLRVACNYCWEDGGSRQRGRCCMLPDRLWRMRHEQL